MLHPANLIHFALFGVYWLLLSHFAKQVDTRAIRVIANLIQITLVCLIVDAAIGFFVIETVFGSSPSAMWIKRAATIIPVLLVLSFWRMRVVRKRARETQ